MSARDRSQTLIADISSAIRRDKAVALFQPIESLQTGTCRGFEALARLPMGEILLTPDQFLPSLDPDDRLCLFSTMLGQAIAFLKRQQARGRDFYVSLNVEISLIASAEFVDILQYFLERHDFSGERLVLEMLENEDVTDIPKLHARIIEIRALGLSVALDDIGNGYACLEKVRTLPVDIVKLDRTFSQALERNPEDLVFALSVQLLAQNLGKQMVVEGIETPEVYDALRMLGVKYGQGFGIARPMPEGEIDAWLTARIPRAPDRIPQCLLGAYASHLTVVESCRALRRQPLPMTWTEAATDYCGCSVGKLFGSRGWHDTNFGHAHAAFHAALPAFDADEDAYTAAMAAFQGMMREAIVSQPDRYRCVAVNGTADVKATIGRPRTARTPKRRAAG